MIRMIVFNTMKMECIQLIALKATQQTRIIRICWIFRLRSSAYVSFSITISNVFALAKALNRIVWIFIVSKYCSSILFIVKRKISWYSFEEVVILMKIFAFIPLSFEKREFCLIWMSFVMFGWKMHLTLNINKFVLCVTASAQHYTAIDRIYATIRLLWFIIVMIRDWAMLILEEGKIPFKWL